MTRPQPWKPGDPKPERSAVFDRIQTKAAQAAWDHRAEYGRGPDRPTDMWAITRLNRAGVLSGEEYGAAMRLASYIENSRPRGSGSDYGRIISATREESRHAIMRSMVLAGQRAENAWRFLAPHLRTERERIISARCWEYPHPSMRDLIEAAWGRDTQTRNTARITVIIRKACSLLAIHFNKCDRDAAMWMNENKAIDGVCEKSQEFGHS